MVSTFLPLCCRTLFLVLCVCAISPRPCMLVDLYRPNPFQDLPEKGGTKVSSDSEPPPRTAHCLTFILKLCWWFTYLQSLEQYIFLHLFVSLARNRTEGEPIPYCSKLPARKPSGLEFFCWSKPVSIKTESIKLPAQNSFKIGVL